MRRVTNKSARIRATCVALICGIAMLGTTAMAAGAQSKQLRKNKAGDIYNSESVGRIEVGEPAAETAVFESEDIYRLNAMMNEIWDLQDKLDSTGD